MVLRGENALTRRENGSWEVGLGIEETGMSLEINEEED
jgi:hypothetical protein